ncbi:MAG: FAD-dependent thymidylate synthase [Candidatus Andersenbacteria bacterium]
MKYPLPRDSFAPPFAPDAYTPAEKWQLVPFFSNLDQSVYAPLIFSPEVIGALCSRASRAEDDLRTIFLREYVAPFLEPETAATEAAAHHGKSLKEFINFLQAYPIEEIFSNPRARSFYAKWLAQYGDDSIAQMAGMHLVFASLSQVAIKHFEDQRIGLAPIEKSTRYVDYSTKINGRWRYYTDPTLRELGLEQAYETAMDGLFTTYGQLLPRLIRWLSERFPEEKRSVVEKKAFDVLRGLLPTSTLSQVAFFGNGQAYEYLVSRSGHHPLGEIRWASERAYEELYKVAPSFLRRIKDPESQALVNSYQEYLSGKGERLRPLVDRFTAAHQKVAQQTKEETSVKLLEYDLEGEAKVITGMLYAAPNNHASWSDIFSRVRALNESERQVVLNAYFIGRTQRWQKVGRALENIFVRFEIMMNIGAWRDLHRHRMLTQQRQYFSCMHGYDVPPELMSAGLADEFTEAIERVERVHQHIAEYDLDLAQYAVTMAHRVRFMQWTNLRECFWEIELRTIPEGHPDYRRIEQEKFRLLQKVYPLLAERMHVNLDEYNFARRGQEEKIQAKLKELTKVNA